MRHLLQLVVFLTFIACQSEMNKVELSNNENDRQFGNNEAIQCQHLWYGDCTYQLCETINWKAFPDSTKDGNTRILVKYIPDNRYVRHKKPIIIYSKVIVKESNPDITLNGYIEEEEKNAVKNGEKVAELAKISTSDSNVAFVKGYVSEKESKYYSIAYIDQSKYIILINSIKI